MILRIVAMAVSERDLESCVKVSLFVIGQKSYLVKHDEVVWSIQSLYTWVGEIDIEAFPAPL